MTKYQLADRLERLNSNFLVNSDTSNSQKKLTIKWIRRLFISDYAKSGLIMCLAGKLERDIRWQK